MIRKETRQLEPSRLYLLAIGSIRSKHWPDLIKTAKILWWEAVASAALRNPLYEASVPRLQRNFDALALVLILVKGQEKVLARRG